MSKLTRSNKVLMTIILDNILDDLMPYDIDSFSTTDSLLICLSAEDVQELKEIRDKMLKDVM